MNMIECLISMSQFLARHLLLSFILEADRHFQLYLYVYTYLRKSIEQASDSILVFFVPRLPLFPLKNGSVLGLEVTMGSGFNQQVARLMLVIKYFGSCSV